MRFFRRQSDPAAGGAEAASRPGAANGTVTHRLTRELARAESLARMLATSRAAAAIEAVDYLAGMYIYDWERLSKYWKERGEIESYLQTICRISPQRWHHWIEFYDKERRAEEGRAPLKFPGSLEGLRPDGAQLHQSGELAAILRKAEAIAPHHDAYEGRPIPILTSECVLLAMTKVPGLEIGRRLIDSGLDLETLEQEARNPRHAPLHGAEET